MLQAAEHIADVSHSAPIPFPLVLVVAAAPVPVLLGVGLHRLVLCCDRNGGVCLEEAAPFGADELPSEPLDLLLKSERKQVVWVQGLGKGFAVHLENLHKPLVRS